MSRLGLICGILIAFWLAGCANTRLNRQKEPWSTAKTRVPPGDTLVASHSSPARGVTLDANNTRVTFVGTAGPTSHEGSFSRLSGRFEWPTEDAREAKLTVEIEMDSVYTKIGLLTAHLKRPDMLDVQKYPKASFVARQIEPSGDGGHVVTGDFMIHGMTKSVTFPARIAATPDEFQFDATFVIRQTEYGLMESASKTKDEVPVTVSIRAPRR